MADRNAALGIFTILLSVGASSSAAAQDMAETAQINAEVLPQQAGAERSLSSAINRRMRASGDALGVPANAGEGSNASRSAPSGYYQSYTIPANIDALAGTDAPTYRLPGSGAVIRISWGLRPPLDAKCIAFCP